MDVSQEIEVPDYVKDVCVVWHDGQASLMYSVASTGKVQYRHIFQLLNDMPHRSDSLGIQERIKIQNARTWLESFVNDDYFEALDEASIQEEEGYSLS